MELFVSESWSLHHILGTIIGGGVIFISFHNHLIVYILKQVFHKGYVQFRGENLYVWSSM